MAKARVGAGLLAGCLLLWAGTSSAWAAPTVAQMLSFRPKQEGITYTIPTQAEQDACKVELVKAGRGSGWLLRDANGKALRRFFDTNGDNKIDIWSYYLNGVEVYREIDSNFNEKADQYRWLNTAGMKWGVDVNEDGKIDRWKAISAEEASQEILQAVMTRDYARLQALMLTDAEMKALELPAAEANRIRELQKQAPAKFQSTVAKVSATGSTARWLHLETQAPQCTPSDTSGMSSDLHRHAKAAILYEANSKAEWLQTGEMIQVGLAWRIVDAPVAGQPVDAADNTLASTDGAPAKVVDPAMQPLLDKLRDLDKNPPTAQGPGANPAVVSYNLQRADLLEQIAAKDKPEERDGWTRQLADSLDSAAQSSGAKDKTAFDRLAKLARDTVQKKPGSALAAYLTYREIRAEYSSKIIDEKPAFEMIQAEWLAKLAKFVSDYPKAEDTPDALLQLGMMSEMDDKKVGEAKKWYEQLLKNFSDHALAAKVKGAIARLEIEGKVLELSGPILGGPGMFTMSHLRNKVVVVYYWASWNQQCISDFAKLKLLLSTYGSKGVELVCVNLDNKAEEATAFLRSNPALGIQLFREGGLDSPLAVQYGIMALPNLFLVGKDGKVVSNKVQVNSLEDEVKKLVDAK
jgi:thiol-disulfide isomerase/thioredoxin